MNHRMKLRAMSFKTTACLALLVAVLIPAGAPLAAVVPPVGGEQKSPAGATETLRPEQRFQLTATVLDKAGKTKTIRATERQWEILGNQRITHFPEQGFLLVQLIGGRVTTVIGGKEQKRHHGEFWTVPAGTPMSVIAVGEDALLEVTSFSGT